jgi:phage terminase small subunit
LSEAAKAVFLDLVSTCDPEHFEASDVTLLGQYCEASALAAKAAAKLQEGDLSQLAIWEKATRAMAGLALRLRLGPQSRRERAKVERPLTWDEKFRLEHYGRL